MPLCSKKSLFHTTFAELVDAAQNTAPRQELAAHACDNLALVTILPQDLAGQAPREVVLGWAWECGFQTAAPASSTRTCTRTGGATGLTTWPNSKGTCFDCPQAMLSSWWAASTPMRGQWRVQMGPKTRCKRLWFCWACGRRGGRSPHGSHVAPRGPPHRRQEARWVRSWGQGVTPKLCPTRRAMGKKSDHTTFIVQVRVDTRGRGAEELRPRGIGPRRAGAATGRKCRRS